MSLVALTNALLADVMTLRFQAEPMVRAIDLLLQERVPTDAPIVETAATAVSTSTGPSSGADGSTEADAGTPMSRRLTTPFTPVPRTHILSNTQYHVMLTNAGSGSSTCRGLDVTRWREDAAREAWGQFCYVRDITRGVVWSAGFQPVCRAPESYEVIFAADKATFRRRDLGIETVLEVIVSPEHRAEIRRVTLINHDASPRELELTSYAEVVLAPRGADLGHPAFGKLFLETEWLPGPEAIAVPAPDAIGHRAAALGRCTSRPSTTRRTGSEPVGDTQYETDRARFLGRGRTPANPAASGARRGPLGDRRPGARPGLQPPPPVPARAGRLGRDGADHRVRRVPRRGPGPGRPVPRGQRRVARLRAGLGAQPGRAPAPRPLRRRCPPVPAAGLAHHLRRRRPAGRARRCWPATDWASPASGGSASRATGRSSWPGSPTADELALVRQLLAAHAYLRLRGLEFDLVLLDEEPGSYLDELNRQLLEAVRAAGSLERVDQPGGVFVRKASQMSEDERVLLQAAARVVLVGDRGSLASQLDRTERYAPLPARLVATREIAAWTDEPIDLPADLLFFNGLGGFTPDGREYCVLVQGSPPPEIGRNGPPAHHPAAVHPRLPPAPWVNVIANPRFGFVVSEAARGSPGPSTARPTA